MSQFVGASFIVTRDYIPKIGDRRDCLDIYIGDRGRIVSRDGDGFQVTLNVTHRQTHGWVRDGFFQVQGAPTSTPVRPAQPKPIRVTCRVLRDWTPNPRGLDPDKKIAIKKGNTGVIYQRDGKGGALISLHVTGAPLSGWVPEQCLEDGVSIDQPLTYKVLNPPEYTPSALPAEPAALAGQTRLVFQRKALTAAILSLREADVQERMLHSDVTYINTDKKVKALVNSTIKKMPKDVQRVLNNENSTIADFFALQQLHEEDSGEGVYLIMYQKPDDTVGFYVGTTVGFRRRFNDHRAAAAAGKGGFHYKFARQAKITHRSFVTLLGTYSKYVLTRRDTYKEADFAFYVHQEDASALNLAATASFRSVGWTPICVHLSFEGLNISSPLTEQRGSGEKPIWTKMHYPEVNMVIFRRPKLRLTSQITPLGGTTRVWAPREITNLGVTVGHLSVEIMTNGQPHEVPYARLERLGPYSNWLDMHQLAVALTFQTLEGEWRKTYLQQQVFHPGKHAARLGYEVAMEIYTTLMQIFWIDPPDFLKGINDSTKPRIKEVGQDHFRRVVTVRDLFVMTRTPSPTMRSQQELAQALTGPPANLRLSATRPPGENPQRKKCDFCILSPPGGYNRCELSDMPDRCKSCKELERPCTFTLKARITPAAAKICYGRPALNSTIYSIESPEFVEFKAGGDSDTEDEEEDEDVEEAEY